MGLATHFAAAPAIRPQFNVGGPFDIPMGVFMTGEHGESILNGGCPHITGVSGRGETGKSLLADYILMALMDRYGADAVVYDTEQTKTQTRTAHLQRRFPNLVGRDLFLEEKLIISDASVMTGESFFGALKDYLVDKKAKGKAFLKTTPFMHPAKDEKFQIITPTASMIDSFSQWLPSTVIAMHNKNDVGSSDLNTEAMKAGSARSQLMAQLPALTSMYGCYILLTAHLGDEIVMEQHAPSKKKLGFLKGDQKMKRVPENYSFLTNNLWMTLKMNVMKKNGSKELEYPLGLAGDSEEQTDLSVIDVQLLRTKSPAAGRIFEVIVSRTEGVLSHLTQFHYIKESDRWGLGGNVQNYFLELAPDIALSRTVVRRKIDSDPKLRRAIEISSDLLQLKDFWDAGAVQVIPPKELYEKIKQAGYDWELLLTQTRGYWMFEEDITPETPYFLSTMDLIKMAQGTYRPWWYDEAIKKKSK
jgi:hypothetical protein